MRQGGKQIDPRLGRVLAEIHNRFNGVAISGDDDVLDLLLSIENAAAKAVGLTSTEHSDAELRPLLLDIAVGSMALILAIDQQAVTEFHRQRRMFYLIGDLLSVGILGDERDHRGWMKDEGDADSYDEAIRGYADSTGVYAYKGHDFSLPPAAEAEFRNHFVSLVDQLNLGAELPVWAGVVPGPLGTRWPGRTKLGTVGELMGW